MQVLILSAGRAEHRLQHTLRAIPRTWRKETHLVVQASQTRQYAPIAAQEGVGLIGLPPRITTISPTRKFLVDHMRAGNFVMLDDDLTFAAVRSDDPTKYVAAGEADVAALLRWLHLTTVSSTPGKGYAHAGIAAREGANRVTENEVECVRMMRVLAYNTAKLKAADVKWGRVAVMEDFDVTLQLLRAGLPNAVSYRWCHNQPGSNTAGGCSVWRTPEIQAQSAQQLQLLHPAFVKVVEKATKTSWGGETRTDVQVSWKKAYASAKK